MLATIAAALSVAPSCAAYAVAEPPGARAQDVRRAAAALKQPLRPSQVGAVLASLRWRLVWVRPAGAEPGVAIFHRQGAALRHVQTWGGALDDSAEALRWATGAAGMPPPLAACFVDRLMTDGP